jgi:hypothetical protein
MQEVAAAKDEFRRAGDHQELKEHKKLNELHEKMLMEHGEKQARSDQDKLKQQARYENDIRILDEKIQALNIQNQDLLSKLNDNMSQK